MSDLPPPKRIEFPFTISRIEVDRSSATEMLIVHPDSTFDLSYMSPRDRWYFLHREQRLAKKGIKVKYLKGEIGTWEHGVRIVR